MKYRIPRMTGRIGKRRSQKSDEDKTLKYFIAPLLSALIVTVVQQFFYEDRIRINEDLIFQRVNLEKQRTILNEILVYSDSYMTSEFTLSPSDKVFAPIIDSLFGGTVENGTLSLPEGPINLQLDGSNVDSIIERFSSVISSNSKRIRVPSFVVVDRDRDELLDLIKSLNDRKYFLDYEVIKQIESLESVIEKNPLPKLPIESSNHAVYEKCLNWSDSTIVQEFESELFMLHEICYRKLYYSIRYSE